MSVSENHRRLFKKEFSVFENFLTVQVDRSLLAKVFNDIPVKGGVVYAIAFGKSTAEG
jgi:hypothetical protein